MTLKGGRAVRQAAAGFHRLQLQLPRAGRRLVRDQPWRRPGEGIPLVGEGFELSSGAVTVLVSPYQEGAGDAREAEALLRIGRNLEVGYGGFYECSR